MILISSSEVESFHENGTLAYHCRGFIAKASSQAIDTIHSLSQEFEPAIENDQTVSINNDGEV